MRSDGHTQDMTIGGVTSADGERGNRTSIAVSILRLLAVVPVAVIVGWFTYGLGGLFLFLREPYYPEFLFPLISLMPSTACSTICGGMTAPRSRVPIAVLLALSSATLALLRHIVVQQNVGLNNCMHATSESLGAAIGVFVVWRLGKRFGE